MTSDFIKLLLKDEPLGIQIKFTNYFEKYTNQEQNINTKNNVPTKNVNLNDTQLDDGENSNNKTVDNDKNNNEQETEIVILEQNLTRNNFSRVWK